MGKNILSAKISISGLLIKFYRLWQREGLAGIQRKLNKLAIYRKGKIQDFSYKNWIKFYDKKTVIGRARINRAIKGFCNKPLISIFVRVDSAIDVRYINDFIKSVRNQSYENWELLIPGYALNSSVRDFLAGFVDKRIKFVFGDGEFGSLIKLNHFLHNSSGKWGAIISSADLLSENALFWVVYSICRAQDIGFIYSDQDKIDHSGMRFDPHFKPDWNIDLFYSQNYIGHLAVFKLDLINDCCLDFPLENILNYDIYLRCIEKLTKEKIFHIPRVLYHSRVCSDNDEFVFNPVSQLAEHCLASLNDHFKRTGVHAQALIGDHGYHVIYDLPDNLPKVNLIIPTKNSLNLIRNCIESVVSKTTYPNYDILIVDNLSDDPDVLNYFTSLGMDSRIRVIRDSNPFNYSLINNSAVRIVDGDLICLLNNDLEVISPDWLFEMVRLAIQPQIGAVGARLLYPDNSLQHGGIILMGSRVAGHSHKYIPCFENGYFNRAKQIQGFSAVTGACLVVRRGLYEEIGGLDEVNLQVAFNDVDFCLRLREKGYRIVWTPYAELYHHESATRGYEHTPEKFKRFAKESRYMRRRWGKSLFNDPAYNPNLTFDYEDFSLAWPPRINGLPS